jgi:hypothetical protein
VDEAEEENRGNEVLLFILTGNEFLFGDICSTIRHNTQITHITQNNTPRSNET